MAEKKWKRGDIDPKTGKVFAQWVTSKTSKRYAWFTTPERLEEMRAQNREAAKRVYHRDPATRIRKVQEWQERKAKEREKPVVIESLDDKGIARAAISISRETVIATGDIGFMSSRFRGNQK